MSGPIKIHMLPGSAQPMGDVPFVSVPLSDIAIEGLVIVCVECGSVVMPQLMDVHQKHHAR